LQNTEKHQIRSSFFLHLAFLLTACALLFQPFSVTANAAYKDGGSSVDNSVRYVYPMGKTVGIKLFSEGVLVIGMSDIKTDSGNSSPAKTCGLQEGDIITHINSEEVNSIEKVQEILQVLAGEKMSVRILRDNTQSQLTAQAAQSSADGSYKLGAWIRDSMAGIGTMTFYDPESKIFGTLGHGINDIDTAMLMPLQSGSIMPSSVSDVKKGLSGQPGELHGTFQVEKDLGQLYANTAGGVFGMLMDDSMTTTSQLLPVSKGSDVKTGKATILSNVSGEQVEEYEVEIIKLFPHAQDTRNLMLHVTDPKLLTATGGIVQGMSGSPIIQDGKLIGAVTHVLLNDPTRGYGIFADNMITLAETAKAELG
jgi:stage IV sporulation protein B